MSQRIRQKETSLRVAIDGQNLEGSFLKVVEYEINPEQKITKTQFCGEMFEDGDTDITGIGGRFKIHELKGDAEQLLDTLIANHKAHLAPPLVTLTEYKKYRGTGAGDRTNVYPSCMLICKSMTKSSGGDYIGSEWEFWVQDREAL